MTHVLDQYWDQLLDVRVDMQAVAHVVRDDHMLDLERSLAMSERQLEEVEQYAQRSRELVHALLALGTEPMTYRECVQWLRVFASADEREAIDAVVQGITDQVAEKFLTMLEDTNRPGLQHIAREASASGMGRRDKSDTMDSFVSVYLAERFSQGS